MNGALGAGLLGEPRSLYKVDPKLAPLPRYLSALGMTGMTAYFALLETGAPKTGDTVVISGAAGAVGSIAGQIAKAQRLSRGGDRRWRRKVQFLVDELGPLTAAIDYKTEDVPAALKRECPKAWTCISITSAAISSTPCSAAWRSKRA